MTNNNTETIDNNSIGLADLIEKVKQELLENQTNTPCLCIDSIELELQITVKQDGKAGIKLYVLEAGGGISRDDVQKVKVIMSPLVSKEELLEKYKKDNPCEYQYMVDQVSRITHRAIGR